MQKMAVIAFIPPFSNRNTLALMGINYDSSIIQPVCNLFNLPTELSWSLKGGGGGGEKFIFFF